MIIMTSTKKIIKRKLKEPDEFITFTERIYLFVAHHAKPIALGAGIVLVLLLLTFLFQTWEKKNAESANQMFNLAVETYQMVSSPYREGSPQEYKSVVESFNEVIAKFPKTQPGKLAILYKGNVYLWLGEFDEAIKAYEDYLKKAGKEKLYRAFAMEGLGYAYEGKRDYAKAVAYLEAGRDKGNKNKIESNDPEMLVSLANSYYRTKKFSEALEIYFEMSKQFPEVRQIQEALQGVYAMEHKSAGDVKIF